MKRPVCARYENRPLTITTHHLRFVGTFSVTTNCVDSFAHVLLWFVFFFLQSSGSKPEKEQIILKGKQMVLLYIVKIDKITN